MDINIWAIVVSAVVAMLIGATWFGPLFGKYFMAVSGMDKWTPQQREEAMRAAGKSYIIQVFASLLMFYVLARFINESGDMTLQGGLVTAAWIWAGIVVPVKVGDAIWGGSWKLSILVAGNMLVTLLATGAIIGAWR